MYIKLYDDIVQNLLNNHSSLWSLQT